MFVLLFRYVFGSAIPIQGISYAEFLLPGIFAQTVVFGSTITGASLADDLQKGLIDRFRSLPMSRSAVLIGRTVADLDRKSTRLNSSHANISYAVFCLQKNTRHWNGD